MSSGDKRAATQVINQRAGTKGRTFGPYRIVDIVTEGGMGVLLKATHKTLERQVALKIISPRIASDLDLVNHFFQEAKIMAAIDHPNVINVHDSGLVDGCPFMATQFHERGDLRRVITRYGALSRDQVLKIMMGIASGLDAIHTAGYIHRDIKPMNILLSREGRAVITDMGLTIPMGAPPAEKRLVGTPNYLAPEQILNEGTVATEQTDVYALGATMFFAATSQAPYRHDELPDLLAAITSATEPPSVRDLAPAIDRRGAGIIERCLHPDVEQRFKRAADVMTECRMALGRSKISVSV